MNDGFYNIYIFEPVLLRILNAGCLRSMHRIDREWCTKCFAWFRKMFYAFLGILFLSFHRRGQDEYALAHCVGREFFVLPKKNASAVLFSFCFFFSFFPPFVSSLSSRRFQSYTTQITSRIRNTRSLQILSNTIC